MTFKTKGTIRIGTGTECMWLYRITKNKPNQDFTKI